MFENILTGDDVDVTKFPSPVWHEKDGGRYIGTGTYSVTRDPEESWLNAGAYRAQVHDKKTVGLVMATGHHGWIHREKYFKRGETMPVAMVLGGDPLALLLRRRRSALRHLRARHRRRHARPADEDGAGQGHRPAVPGQCRDRARRLSSIRRSASPEGPFGEWSGHYAGGVRDLPVLDIQAIYHRNDPILLGVPPMGGGPDEMARYRAVMRSAIIKQNMANAGVPGVKQVWCHEVGGARMLHGVSITQRYPGHAVQAAHVAAQCGASAYASKYIVVVRRRCRRHQSRPHAVGDDHPHRSRGIDPVHQGLVGFQRRPRDSRRKRARPATSRIRSR